MKKSLDHMVEELKRELLRHSANFLRQSKEEISKLEAQKTDALEKLGASEKHFKAQIQGMQEEHQVALQSKSIV